MIDSLAESIEDIDSTKKRTEEMSSTYRNLHNELALHFGDPYEERNGKECLEHC